MTTITTRDLKGKIVTIELFSTAQAAERVQRSEPQVRALANKHEIGTRIGDRVLVFTSDDLGRLATITGVELAGAI